MSAKTPRAGFRELTNKAFYRKTIILMLPIVLQQLISIGVNFFDNLMIGGLGEITISAASFSNMVYSVFQFIGMGLGSGAVVMSSQYWGARDMKSLHTTASMAVRVTLLISAVFTVIAVTIPGTLLRIFTPNAAIIAEGTTYMRILGFTFILSGLASIASYLLRSVGNVTVPLIGSAGAFFLNIFFNWVFIFGKLGAPALGLVGAGVGTAIARVFEFLFIFGHFMLRDKTLSFRFKDFFVAAPKEMSKLYVHYSVPLIVSDTLLGVSLALTSVILGHIGAEISAASSIVGTVVNLLSMLNMGMAGAAAVVIGNTIGEGDIVKAKSESNCYILLSFIIGLILVVPIVLFQDAYLSLYNISANTYDICKGCLLVNCFFLPVQAIAYVISKGILRGGGDTKFLLYADTSCIWFISLPLGALAGFVWNMSPFWIYFMLRLEFPLKGLICLARYLFGNWLHVIKKDKTA